MLLYKNLPAYLLVAGHPAYRTSPPATIVDSRYRPHYLRSFPPSLLPRPSDTTKKMSLPPITTLSSSPAQIQTVLDHLFEPCPTLYTLVASHLPRSFASYDEFADFVADLLFALDDQDKLLDVLGAHPRLGAKRVESVHSQGEQRSLAADGGEEAERLERLNDEYERAFPGKFCHGWVRE